MRITGPGIKKAGDQACADWTGPTADCAETDLFVVQGKVQPGPSARTSVPSWDFGNVTSPVTKAITYTSTRSEAVTVSGVALSGANADDFALAENCTTAGTVDAPGVAAGSSCAIDVTYTPRSGAKSAANLTITDSTTGSPRTLSFGGSSVGVATKDLSAMGFATQKVSTVSAPDVVTVGNDGVAPITVGAPTITGTSAAHFRLASNGCATVARAPAARSASLSRPPVPVTRPPPSTSRPTVATSPSR